MLNVVAPSDWLASCLQSFFTSRNETLSYKWMAIIKNIFCHSNLPSDNGRIWTHILKSVSQAIYHCAMGHRQTKFETFLSILVQVVGFKPTILRLWVKYSTTVLWGTDKLYLKHFFAILSLPVLVVGFEPTILRIRVECSTTVLRGHRQTTSETFLQLLSLPGLVAGF